MIRRLAIAIVFSATVVEAASVASPPFWQVFDDDWCLVESSTRKFCVANATMKRSWRHGARFEVANPDDGPALVLGFQYFDSEGNPGYDGVDESFELVTSEDLGPLVVKRYKVKLGDLPRSTAEYVTITEPSVFSIAFVGGTEEMRNNFVNSFVAAWSK